MNLRPYAYKRYTYKRVYLLNIYMYIYIIVSECFRKAEFNRHLFRLGWDVFFQWLSLCDNFSYLSDFTLTIYTPNYLSSSSLRHICLHS